MLSLLTSRNGRPLGPALTIPIFVLGFLFGRLLPSVRLTSPGATAYGPYQPAAIPPILHFTLLKASPTAELHISFEAFLSVYSAFLAVSPSAIYLHTDHSAADVAHAMEHGSSWTRKLLTAFPSGLVRRNYVRPPTKTPAGVPIPRLEVQSELVRHEQLAKYGGVYLDWDVLTLKPLAPLLQCGFHAVVGKQEARLNTVHSGVVLATKGAALVALLNQEAPRLLDSDGQWTADAVHLLTNVSHSVANVPGQVLIMDQSAFTPTSRAQESVNTLLERHDEAGVPEAFTVGSRNDLLATSPARVYGDNRESLILKTRAWELDFSEAFFLHNVLDNVENPRGYSGVSVPYVLSRDSNYARAAYTIVQKGIKDGFIDEHDDSL